MTGGIRNDDAVRMLVFLLRAVDEQLAEQLAAGVWSKNNLDRAEEFLADLLVTRGFRQDWSHNIFGQQIEELIGWIVGTRCALHGERAEDPDR